jgi:hypothetical protein
MLKKLFLGLLILTFVALSVGYLLPRQFSLTRSLRVLAPAERVFPLINDLREWPTWTVWDEATDPDCKWTFTGEAGVGSTMQWNGPKHGQGFLRIVTSDDETGITYEMAFEPELTDDNKVVGSITMEDNSGTTTVTWSFSGDLGMNPIHRYFGVLMEGLVGPDFEKGLERLKHRAERGS